MVCRHLGHTAAATQSDATLHLAPRVQQAAWTRIEGSLRTHKVSIRDRTESDCAEK
jgi:hypothetical protein